MFTMLRRVFPTLTGLILLSAFIWYAGPLFAFAAYRPLESVTARLIAVALVWVIWAGSVVVKRLKARLAGQQLAAAIVRQSAPEPQPSAEAVRLREGFEEAVAALSGTRGARGLYDLPWYVIVGAPGSGKTTALVNSGLHFPLEQRSGRNALRGIGGTRDCDWWFTDEAVFLDTAGRYTTQDSDAGADAEGWREFLGLLRKHRRRQPINGILLTISAQDLMAQPPGAPDPHVDAARRRLVELERELKVRVPVYVLVTKCDLVAGFTEYFDDLAQEGRAQVWGVTFPYDQTAQGQAAAAFPVEFDALVTRLNERVFVRVEDERDPRRRARLFAFPQQLAALRGALTGYVAEVFGATRFDHPVLLRGVYFTSGTQEGTPIDRLLASLGRRFALAPDAVPPPPGRGKAYFIEHVLHQVVLRESGLGGVNRRFELQWAAAQVGAYVAIAAVGLGAIALWGVSYSRNRAYLDAVAADVARLREVPPAAPAAALDAALPRLDAVRAVADSAGRYGDSAPWGMTWGLFQGDSVRGAARDAYARELRGAMLPHAAAQFRQRLIDYAAQPERLYPYLKGYLMLGNPRYLDPEQLEYLVGLEWEAAYGGDPDRKAAIAGHFQNLVAYTSAFPATPIDERIVAQARSSLQRASQADLVYRYIRIAYASDAARALRLDVAAGLGAEQVLRRKSRVALSEPVASLYTKPVFEEITTQGIGQLVKQFVEEYWVWGDDRPSITTSVSLQNDVLQVYEADYIAAWDGIVGDIEGPALPSLAATKEAVAILGGPTSPLRNFLKVVDEHTYLAPPPKPAAPGILDSLGRKVGTAIGVGQEKLGLQTLAPGTRVTAHFAPIHTLVGDGSGAAPIDGVIQKMQELGAKLQPIGDQVGGTKDPGALAAVTQTATELKRGAGPLPSSIGDLVSRLADGAAASIRGDVRTSLQSLYEQSVLRECEAIITGRYPFAPAAATDVPLVDFARLFGSDGAYDRFFRDSLAELVDTSKSSWAWRPDATGTSVGGSAALLRTFQAADAIRRTFFRPGTQEPVAQFTVNMPELDPDTLRFSLVLDGQTYEYRHGPDRPVALKWPGATAGPVIVTFEGRSARETMSFEGPWAFFRLADSAPVETVSDTSYIFDLQKGGRSARLRFTADSIRNPFGRSLLRQFSCR